MATIEDHAEAFGDDGYNELGAPVLADFVRLLRSMSAADASFLRKAVLEGRPTARPLAASLYPDGSERVIDRIAAEIIDQEFGSSTKVAQRVFEVRVSGRYGVNVYMSVSAHDREEAIQQASDFVARFKLVAS